MKKLILSFILINNLVMADGYEKINSTASKTASVAKKALGFKEPKNLQEAIEAIDLPKVKSFIDKIDNLSDVQKNEMLNQIEKIKLNLKTAVTTKSKIFNSMRLVRNGAFEIFNVVWLVTSFQILLDNNAKEKYANYFVDIMSYHKDVHNLSEHDLKKWYIDRLSFLSTWTLIRITLPYYLIYWINDSTLKHFNNVFRLSKLENDLKQIEELVVKLESNKAEKAA